MPIFFTKNLATGGRTTPQMPLTVNSVLYLGICKFRHCAKYRHRENVKYSKFRNFIGGCQTSSNHLQKLDFTYNQSSKAYLRENIQKIGSRTMSKSNSKAERQPEHIKIKTKLSSAGPVIIMSSDRADYIFETN